MKAQNAKAMVATIEERMVNTFVSGVIWEARETLARRQSEAKQWQKMRESIYQYDSSIADRDEASWVPTSIGTDKRFSATEPNFWEVIATSRELYLKNTHARGIVRDYVKYVIGQGMIFTPVDMKANAAREAKEIWKMWCRLAMKLW